MKVKGVITALVTPFNKDGSIDEKALRGLVDFQVSAGVDGILPMGTTGESPTLSHGEHIHVIEIVIDQAQGKVPIIAGTGSNCTQEAVEMTQQAMECGANASLQVAPYYNKPTQEGFYRHFMAIADSVDLPMIVYNIPGRSAKNIENSTMLRLANHPNIAGVKEASGNIGQVMDLIKQKPESFDLVSGDDNLAYSIIVLGGTGVISVASNYIPKLMKEFVEKALGNDFLEARKIHYRLLPFFKALFIETNPIPVKYVLALKGKIQEYYRLPMCPLEDEHKKALENILKDLGI